MKPASEVLASVRSRLSSPEALSRTHQAVDKDGNPSSPLSKDAVAWGIIGAVYAAGLPREYDLSGAIDYIYKVVSGSISIFSQDASHESILAVIDKALESAKEDGR